MSAFVQRSDELLANEFEWLEFSDRNEMSPASVWAPDYEVETIHHRKSIEARELEQITASRDAESSLNKTSPRARVLDESQVLPGEASFVTVMLNERSAVRAYSPMEEFFAKSKLNWKNVTLGTLLLFSISAGITLLILKIMEGSDFSAHPTANAPVRFSPTQPEPTAAQTQLKTSNPPDSVVVSGEQKQVNPVISTPVGAAKPGMTVKDIAINKPPKATVSESPRQTAPDEIKTKLAGKGFRQDAKSVQSKAESVNERLGRKTTAQKRSATVKQPVISKRVGPTERVEVNNSRSETMVRGESSSLASDPKGRQPKGESGSTPSTGGGQRPRTVTPKDP